MLLSRLLAIVCASSLGCSTALAASNLILHNFFVGPTATPTYIRDNQRYLDTIPFDGLSVYIRKPDLTTNITSMVFRPTPVSYDTIYSVLSPMQGVPFTSLKHNFGLMFSGPGINMFDDAKWSVRVQNMRNFARALKYVGLKGIMFDNENYEDWANYGSTGCSSPYTLIACQEQARKRGVQIMQALMSEYGDITVLSLYGPWVSDRTFYERFTTYNDVAHANELTGPFFVGMVEAAQGSGATVVDGGELYNARTASDFAAFYRYQKYDIVSDGNVPADAYSRASGGNGFIPAYIRSAWPSLVSVGAGLYDRPEYNSKGTYLPMDPTIMKATVTNALKQVDRYAWLYPETISFLEPPGTSQYSASSAWVQAVRDGRAAALAIAPLAILSSAVTSVSAAGATIEWVTNQPATGTLRYGTSTAYSQSVSLPIASTRQVTAVAGLLPSTVYHYRITSATSDGSSVTTADLTFTTAPAQSPEPAPGSDYLSDRNPTFSSNGWGPFERNMSNGEKGAGDGRRISIRGVTYAKGLGVHAPSELRYAVSAGCSTLSAVLGIDDEVAANGSVSFQVWADGVKLYESALLTRSTAPLPMSVNVSGRSELRLITLGGPDGVNFDHADWADARFVCGNTSYLGERTPAVASNGWGPIEVNQSNGERAAGDGRTMSIRGRAFLKGIGVHAPSDVRYDLAGRCSTFSATIGVDDEVPSDGSVVFQVLADGTKLYDSGVVTRSSPPRDVNVNVSGKNVLQLLVTGGADGINYDHADWAEARVVCR